MTRYKVVLSAQATTDLDDIADFIASRSPMNAVRFMKKLENAILGLDRLGAALGRAPESDAFDFPLRQLVVSPYRVLYRLRDDTVEVLHVRHGARLPAHPPEITLPD